MNGLNDASFSPSKSGLATFDAFPKTRSTYRISTSRGGALTVFLTVACLYLTWHEFLSHLSGAETQRFTVEKSVSHSMQINLDITIAMSCNTVHVNVQDAALDRILAGDVLTKDDTSFDDTSAHRLVHIPRREEHVYEVLKKARKSKFGKTEKRPLSFLRGKEMGSCRVYGSMDVNRVQGDFHITVKGHGYWSEGEHIDHSRFNFSHVVNELSFGDLYPSLANPLDGVVSTTEENFYKYQYFLSIVPTTYTSYTTGRSLLTNQYAVTEHSHGVSTFQVPGIFFKYDIEPLSLVIDERKTPFMAFLVRVINIIGGVMVSGNWSYKLVELFMEFFRRKRRSMEGVLNGRQEKRDD